VTFSGNSQNIENLSNRFSGTKEHGLRSDDCEMTVDPTVPAFITANFL